VQEWGSADNGPVPPVWKEVRCPVCNKLLFERRQGGEQRIICRCRRVLHILATGKVVILADAATS